MSPLCFPVFPVFPVFVCPSFETSIVSYIVMPGKQQADEFEHHICGQTQWKSSVECPIILQSLLNDFLISETREPPQSFVDLYASCSLTDTRSSLLQHGGFLYGCRSIY